MGSTETKSCFACFVIPLSHWTKKPLTPTYIWLLSLMWTTGTICIHSSVKWLCSRHMCLSSPAPTGAAHMHLTPEMRKKQDVSLLSNRLSAPETKTMYLIQNVIQTSVFWMSSNEVYDLLLSFFPLFLPCLHENEEKWTDSWKEDYWSGL